MNTPALVSQTVSKCVIISESGHNQVTHDDADRIPPFDDQFHDIFDDFHVFPMNFMKLRFRPVRACVWHRAWPCDTVFSWYFDDFETFLGKVPNSLFKNHGPVYPEGVHSGAPWSVPPTTPGTTTMSTTTTDPAGVQLLPRGTVVSGSPGSFWFRQVGQTPRSCSFGY